MVWLIKPCFHFAEPKSPVRGLPQILPVQYSEIRGSWRSLRDGETKRSTNRACRKFNSRPRNVVLLKRHNRSPRLFRGRIGTVEISSRNLVVCKILEIPSEGVAIFRRSKSLSQVEPSKFSFYHRIQSSYYAQCRSFLYKASCDNLNKYRNGSVLTGKTIESETW